MHVKYPKISVFTVAKASRLRITVLPVAKASRTSTENYPKCDRCSNKEPVKIAKRKKTVESDLQKKKRRMNFMKKRF